MSSLFLADPAPSDTNPSPRTERLPRSATHSRLPFRLALMLPQTLQIDLRLIFPAKQRQDSLPATRGLSELFSAARYRDSRSRNERSSTHAPLRSSERMFSLGFSGSIQTSSVIRPIEASSEDRRFRIASAEPNRSSSRKSDPFSETRNRRNRWRFVPINLQSAETVSRRHTA